MAGTQIKICGIMRPEDAERAADLGADHIGLNFVGGPRRIGYAPAIDIVKDLPPRLRVVALMNGAELFQGDYNEIFDPLFRVSIFQLYGDYSQLPDASFFADKERWAIVHLASDQVAESIQSVVNTCRFQPHAVLLDAAQQGMLGGTGQTFNWNWIAEARAAGELVGLPPIILAGGLTPDNVGEAIRIARPYAVDVSSGVEVSGKPGIKDAIKMRDFIQAAQGA